ncbi:hypothetical protein AB1N83_003419 [Pleurotus pulmonarius]
MSKRAADTSSPDVRPTHKPRRSIGEMGEVITRKVFEAISTAQSEIQANISTLLGQDTSIEDVDELEEFNASMTKLRVTMETITEAHKSGSQDVKSIRLSSLKARDLPRLGLQLRDIHIFEQVTFEQMMDDLASHELSAIGAGSKGLLVDTTAFTARLKTIQRHVNLENEAGSRMIVDHILLDLSDITDAINVHLQLYAELRLTRTNHPVKVDYLGSITFLTGIADYGLTALPLQKLSQHTRTLNANHDFIEAKPDGSDLDDHIPQVVGQCLVGSMWDLVKPLNGRSQDNAIDTFCLTTGLEWVFGLLRRFDGKMVCKRSSQIRVEGGKVKQALFVWAVTPGHQLWKQMETVSIQVS